MDYNTLSEEFKKGNIDSIKEIIHNHNRCLKASDKDDGQLPLLHLSCLNGELLLVKFLIEQGCDPVYPATVGPYYTAGTQETLVLPIHCAVMAKTNKVDILKYLIEEIGVNPDEKNKFGTTPILLAQKIGSLDVIEYLTRKHGCQVSLAMLDMNEEVNELSEEDNHDTIFEGYCVPKSIKSDENENFLHSTSQIHKAAIYGNTEELKELIKKGSNPQKIAEHGYQPIHAAATAGQIEVLKTLIRQYGVDPKAKTKMGGFQPIHSAALNGFTSVVEYLVKERGVSVEEISEYGDKPIHFACSAGKVDMLHLLIELGSSQNSMNESMMPIHIASTQGRTNIIIELIDTYKVSKDVVDEEGFSPIHYAARGNKQNSLELLIDKYNVPPDLKSSSNGYTVLHFCALYGHLDLFNWLCKRYEMNPRIISHDDYEPIHIAAQHGQLQMIELLVKEYGIDPNTPAGDSSQQPIHMAAFYGHTEVVKGLIKSYDVNPATQSKNGLTAVHDAAQRGHGDIVEMLINEFNVDPKSGSISDGFQPIHSACLNGQSHIMEILISKCNVNPREEMKNKAQCIHVSSTAEVIDLLVEKWNVDLLAQDEHGETILHYASAYGWNHILEHIVAKYKIGLNVMSKVNKQPIHAAAAFGQNDTLSLLIDRYGIYPKETSDLQMQCIHWAALCGKMSILKILINEYKIDPEQKSQYELQPIHFAAFGGSEAVVENLIKCDGVLPTATAEYGITPICLAKLAGHDDVVMLLIEEFNQEIPSIDQLDIIRNCGAVESMRRIKQHTV